MKHLRVPCPKCGLHTLFLTWYHVTLSILKNRQWHVCTSCGYERSVEKLKVQLMQR